jgi:hypothetical protein
MRPPNAIQSITTTDLGECDEIDKLVLAKTVLQEELSKHQSLMQSWSGDVLGLWQTLNGPVSQEHPWFSLLNSLLPPRTEGTEGDQLDIGIVPHDEEDTGGSDVDGEEINATHMINLLNITNID